LDDEEKLLLRDIHLLTNKKFVYACNVSEEMMSETQESLKNLIGVENANTQVVPICAKLEEDMLEMSTEEKKEFLDDM
jgi:ribosome-binding ATPase YchF (GTP1/OBG family)